jgi:hypothetical protein
MRPRRQRGAILQLSPRGEIASPYRYHRPGRPPSVNGPGSPFSNKPSANGRSLRFRPKTRVASGRTPAIWSPIQSGMKLGSDRQSLWRARKRRRGEPAVHLALPCPSLTVMDAAMGSPQQRCRPGSTDRREILRERRARPFIRPSNQRLYHARSQRARTRSFLHRTGLLGSMSRTTMLRPRRSAATSRCIAIELQSAVKASAGRSRLRWCQ